MKNLFFEIIFNLRTLFCGQDTVEYYFLSFTLKADNFDLSASKEDNYTIY